MSSAPSSRCARNRPPAPRSSNAWRKLTKRCSPTTPPCGTSTTNSSPCSARRLILPARKSVSTSRRRPPPIAPRDTLLDHEHPTSSRPRRRNFPAAVQQDKVSRIQPQPAEQVRRVQGGAVECHLCQGRLQAPCLPFR